MSDNIYSIQETLNNILDISTHHITPDKELFDTSDFVDGYHGYDRTGIPHTEETKKRISDALKGRKHTEEHKRNISKSSNPYIRTPEHNAMQSAKQKGKILSEEHKRNINEAKKGMKLIHTDETKRKISEAGKKRWAKKKGIVM